MQELTLQAKMNVELFRGNRKDSNYLPVSPLDGYRYAKEELTTVCMNEADEESGSNVIYLFTLAQRTLNPSANTLG